MEYAPSGMKNWAVTKLIGDYGKMMEFKFNPDKKQIYAKLKLAGEKEPIVVEITDYELKKVNEKSFVNIKNAHADREWINILIRDVLVGKNIPVPADKYKLIHEILKP